MGNEMGHFREWGREPAENPFHDAFQKYFAHRRVTETCSTMARVQAAFFAKGSMAAQRAGAKACCAWRRIRPQKVSADLRFPCMVLPRAVHAALYRWRCGGILNWPRHGRRERGHKGPELVFRAQRLDSAQRSLNHGLNEHLQFQQVFILKCPVCRYVGHFIVFPCISSWSADFACFCTNHERFLG